MLTDAQQLTLYNALMAETDASIVEARLLRLDDVLTAWVNAATTTDAWSQNVSRIALFEAIDLTKFDGITQGKRDAWRLMLEYAPIDLRKNAYRKAILDCWGTTDSVAILQACVRKATWGEMLYGGTTATTNTVSAMKLTVAGIIPKDDVSHSFNVNTPNV